jgi:HSP20 family protein
MVNELEVMNEIENRLADSPRFSPAAGDVFDRMFEYPFGRAFGEYSAAPRQAIPNIQETDQGYFLSLDVPGIPLEDIDVSVSGNLLTIRGESREEEDDKGGFRKQYRKVLQTLSLPTTAVTSDIQAHCENGILEVMIPKTAEAKPRKIDVQLSRGKDWKKRLEKSKH